MMSKKIILSWSLFVLLFLKFTAVQAQDSWKCGFCGKWFSVESVAIAHACSVHNYGCSTSGSGTYTGPTQQQIDEQNRLAEEQRQREQKAKEEAQRKHDELMNTLIQLPDPQSGKKPTNDLHFDKPEQGGTVDLSNDPIGLDYKPKTVDHRYSLTKDMCSTSKERRDKLLKENEKMNAVVVKLKSELQKVAGIKKDQQGYKKEFDDIRAEAVKGTLSDVLDAVPIEGMAQKLGELPEYKKYGASLEGYFNAIKAINDGSDAVSSGNELIRSKEQNDKIKNSVQTMGKYKDVLLAIPGIPQKEKEYLDALGKMAEAIAKASMTQCKDCKNLTNAELSTYVGDGLVSSLKIVGVYAPPVRIAVAIESLGERVATGIITQEAEDALNTALNKNFDANLYLNIKISQLNSIMDGNKKTIADDDRIVKGYEEYNHTTCCGPCPK